MAKKYYWLKLQSDFFSQKPIKKLRRIAGGDTFTIIYLKMQLLALKHDGAIQYDGIEDSFEEELALELDEEIDNVKLTVSYLKNYGMIEERDNQTFELPETMANIGTETGVARRVRKHRAGQKALPCNTDVTNCNTEIEREKSKEKEKPLSDFQSNDITPDESFIKFWDMYGKKDGKKKCQAKWNRISKKDQVLIFNALPKYVGSTPDRQFRKNPLSYLNGECWNDEIVNSETEKPKQIVPEWM